MSGHLVHLYSSTSAQRPALKRPGVHRYNPSHLSSTFRDPISPHCAAVRLANLQRHRHYDTPTITCVIPFYYTFPRIISQCLPAGTMPFTNNNMLTIACTSSQLTTSNECNEGCDGISGDASFEFEVDFCAEYSSSESESASTSRSESPDILHELHHGSMTGQHLNYYRSHELAPHTPSQAPSRAHARPSIRTRSLTLPATTSTATASRAASHSASATAAPPPAPPAPPARPTLAVARTTDTPAPKRSIYKKPHSYDLRYDFLHAAPAARAALARFHRQIFHAPPSQPPAQAFPSMPAPHLAALDAAAQRRIQGG